MHGSTSDRDTTNKQTERRRGNEGGETPDFSSQRSTKSLALSGHREGAATFLLRQLGAGDSLVLVHVCALVAQPLVAERAQALSERRFGTLGAALEGEKHTGRRGHRYARARVCVRPRVRLSLLATLARKD